MNKKIKQPLEDINILDLTRVLAGPTSTQILGDLGANIIKIERPLSGDDSRNLGPPYLDKNLKKPMESSYFLSVNRNKNSVELDFTKKEGQELAKKLILKLYIVQLQGLDKMVHIQKEEVTTIWYRQWGV